ncbi:MAG: helix-turn-helix domain-containing protein [Aeromonadaceae bacterium]
MTRYDRSLDGHVSNLRQKLGLLADGRSPIQTVRGIGYQLLDAR